MIQHTKDSIRHLADLRAELDWLTEEHPDKVQLIAVAESALRTVEQAGCTDSTMYASERAWLKKMIEITGRK